MNIIKKWNSTSLILRIFIGLAIGAILGLAAPGLSWISVLGTLFVGALKAVAPILVFVLVSSSLANAKGGAGSAAKFRRVIFLYLFSTLCAAVVAVIGLTLFLALNGKKKEPECIYGVCEYYSTYSNEIIKDSYRYSDDWFSEKPSVQNDELALLSMQLTASVVNDDDSGSGVRFLTDLGFDQTGFVGFDKDDPYNISFMWGKKEIDGQTVMAVVLQSYSLDSGVKELAWKQNFTVNGPEAGSEFYSYSLGADRMVESVTGIAGSGNVKYWIMGQSRGGAYSNVLAARLLDQAGVSAKRIYAYTFEAPNTVEQSAVPDNESRYDFIHNYICDDDIVTAVPMWGMTRYGVTHLLNTPENEAALPGVRYMEKPKAQGTEHTGSPL